MNILVKIGFNEDNVASWSELIEIPLGVFSTLFIARIAIISGFPFLHTNLYSGGKRVIINFKFILYKRLTYIIILLVIDGMCCVYIP
jgi:hypothetical protein